MIKYDEQKTVRALSLLPAKLRSAFAAACAERLLPAYLAFSKQTGRGHPEWISSIADRLWQDLEGDEMSPEQVQEAARYCEQLVPGENQEPWSSVQAYADDAAAAMAYALRCRQNGDEQEAAWASRRAYEALDHFVISLNDDENGTVNEDRVLSHPLVQTELMRQERDLEELAASPQDAMRSLIARIKLRARAESKDFFGKRLEIFGRE
jgi:uncharacterized protein YjaG (DUF416 family)